MTEKVIGSFAAHAAEAVDTVVVENVPLIDGTAQTFRFRASVSADEAESFLQNDTPLTVLKKLVVEGDISKMRVNVVGDLATMVLVAVFGGDPKAEKEEQS